MVLTVVKALLMPLAREDIPAVAAKATNAMINTYSIKPWPASSWCRRTSELRIRLFISFFSYFCGCPSVGRGVAMGYTERAFHVHERSQTVDRATVTRQSSLCTSKH